jgi:hypothetical protein
MVAATARTVQRGDKMEVQECRCGRFTTLVGAHNPDEKELVQ